MNNDTLQATVGNVLANAIDAVSPHLFLVQAGDRRASGIVFDHTADATRIVTSSRLFHRNDGAPVSIRTASGATYTAALVGFDEATELALVLVPGPLAISTDAPALSWIEAGAVRVGQFVAPVARTEHGPHTTLGVISAVGPAWVTGLGGSVDAHLDVDGNLPAGFSGGPLIDFEGRVLGINTRGLVAGGATLPTATVRRVVAALARGETARPAHLGVAIRAIEIPGNLPEATRGLLVTHVASGSPAAHAGIVAGDAIVAIDDTVTHDHAHLLAALAGKNGAVVKVKVVRGPRIVELEARPVARAEARRGHGCGR